MWEMGSMIEIVRWLTQVVAVKHAKRKTDKDNYPGLEDFNRFKNEPGSVDGYLQPRPFEALSYILDELRTTNNLAYQMMDRTGDGLALLVSNLCRAAAMQLPGETYESLDYKSQAASEAVTKRICRQEYSYKLNSLDGVPTIISKSDEQVTSLATQNSHVHRLTKMLKADFKERTSVAVAFKFTTHAIV